MSSVKYPFIKYVLATPLRICGGSSNFGIYAMMKSSLQFNSARAYKNVFSAGVEAAATLLHSDTQKGTVNASTTLFC